MAAHGSIPATRIQPIVAPYGMFPCPRCGFRRQARYKSGQLCRDCNFTLTTEERKMWADAGPGEADRVPETESGDSAA